MKVKELLSTCFDLTTFSINDLDTKITEELNITETLINYGNRDISFFYPENHMKLRIVLNKNEKENKNEY